MKRCVHILWVVVISVLTFSCGKSIIGGDQDLSPEHNFEILWQEFNDFYALFETKNVDWDGIYRFLRPRITPQSTQQELFAICALMLEYLNDRHVGLVTPFSGFVSGRSDEPLTFDPSIFGRDTTITFEFGGGRDEPFDFDRVRNYVGNMHSQGSLQYGIIQNHIGYLFIPGFSGSVKDWERDIDAVLEQLHNTSGVMIDLRQNRGGVSGIARVVMARFVETTQVYGYEEFRNGPNRSDFTSPRELKIEPAGTRQYINPIVLLVGKNTASAAEIIVLALREFSYVTVVGSPTAGALGGTKRGQLPNGWTYQLTISKFVSANMISYEGTGIPPDIAIGSSDSPDAGDLVLEKGIEILVGGPEG